LIAFINNQLNGMVNYIRKIHYEIHEVTDLVDENESDDDDDETIIVPASSVHTSLSPLYFKYRLDYDDKNPIPSEVFDHPYVQFRGVVTDNGRYTQRTVVSSHFRTSN